MSDTVGARGAREVRENPGGHLMILDHLELCWTDVRNLQDGPVQTFCSLYGGIRAHLGPKMEPKIGPRGPLGPLKIHLKKDVKKA